MRAVLTRVKSASVAIDGEVVGKIGQGFLILLGVGPNDNEQTCRYLAEKALGLRVFEDENGKMNLGLDQVGGEVLVVSQFTLYGRSGARKRTVRKVPFHLPGAGLSAPARPIRRRYAGGIHQRWPGDLDFGHRSADGHTPQIIIENYKFLNY